MVGDGCFLHPYFIELYFIKKVRRILQGFQLAVSSQ